MISNVFTSCPSDDYNPRAHTCDEKVDLKIFKCNAGGSKSPQTVIYDAAA